MSAQGSWWEAQPSLPGVAGVLEGEEVAATAEAIAGTQLPSGMIPWFPGGHADPWNHVEAAMALSVSGRWAEAELAYDWLVATQHRDGSWCTYYLTNGVEQPRRDTNVCAYVATGAFQHWLASGDTSFAARLWPVVDKALRFVLRYQRPGGELAWAVDPGGQPWTFALRAGSSSVLRSLRCGLALARVCGEERPAWAAAADRLAEALQARPRAFADKDRWAMDWYYPILAGAVTGAEARVRLAARRPGFVIEGLGVRCVADRPWATAAETAEYALALDATGAGEEARQVLAWLSRFRVEDGSYWTGLAHPELRSFPGGERSTYSAAAVILAAAALTPGLAGGGVFRGEGQG